MLVLCSFLRGAFLFVKSIVMRVSKSDYRRKAVLISAGLVFAVAVFTSSGFGGGGKSALTVFAENVPTAEENGEDEAGEIETITEADIRFELTDRTEEGQRVVGSLLVKEMKETEESRIRARRELDDIQEEIRREELEKKREELKRAQEAAKRAEEERRRREEEAERRAEEQRQEEEKARLAAAAVPMTQEDYQVLLRIVQAEAGICDSKGRILVANVILNRVRSDEFPDTVTGVVYQRSQFSPVADGSIHTCKVTAETIDCVERAICGEDYSQGALYFMNRRGSSSKNTRWFDNHLTYLFSHDRHEFFK